MAFPETARLTPPSLGPERQAAMTVLPLSSGPLMMKVVSAAPE